VAFCSPPPATARAIHEGEWLFMSLSLCKAV
jgi:hypothetical protein